MHLIDVIYTMPAESENLVSTNALVTRGFMSKSLTGLYNSITRLYISSNSYVTGLDIFVARQYILIANSHKTVLFEYHCSPETANLAAPIVSSHIILPSNFKIAFSVYIGDTFKSKRQEGVMERIQMYCGLLTFGVMRYVCVDVSRIYIWRVIMFAL
jgi:hypothetical protein